MWSSSLYNDRMHKPIQDFMLTSIIKRSALQVSISRSRREMVDLGY